MNDARTLQLMAAGTGTCTFTRTERRRWLMGVLPLTAADASVPPTTFKMTITRLTMARNTLAEEQKTRGAGDAWLEEALLLAAAELAAFRATAQAERDRMLQAQENARQRVQALEQELKKREQEQADEAAKFRQLVDSQLGERAKAWTDFSEGLQQRLASMSQLQAQHEADVEEAGNLRRQLHSARGQLEAATETHRELERRLSQSEESFAVAAAELQKSRDEATALMSQCAEVSRELSASASHCAQLQNERRSQDSKLAEADQLRERLDRERRELSSKLEDARAELTQLKEKAETLSQLQAAHTELRTHADATSAELQGVKTRIADLEKSESELGALQTKHEELKRKHESLEQDLTSARSKLMELDLTARELSALAEKHEALEHRAETLGQELSASEKRVATLIGTSDQLDKLRDEHRALLRKHEELREDLLQAQQRAGELEQTSQELTQARQSLKELQASHDAQRSEVERARVLTSDAARAQADAQRMIEEAQSLEQEAKARIAEAEMDVQAARRERDQVRASFEKGGGSMPPPDVAALRTEVAQLKGELEEQSNTRWAMLDMEKQRSYKLKQELDQARAELQPALRQIGRLRAELERLYPGGSMAPDANFETPSFALDDVRVDPVAGLALKPPSTVPINSTDTAPTAPQPSAAAARPREGSKYSYTEVGEEQVYVPSKFPIKGGKGKG